MPLTQGVSQQLHIFIAQFDDKLQLHNFMINYDWIISYNKLRLDNLL